MKVNITLLHTLVYTENKEKKLKMKVNIVILCYLQLTPPWSPSDCWVTGFASNPLSNFMLFDVSLTAISPMSYSSAQSLTDVQSFLSIFKCYLSLPHRCSSYPALSPYHIFKWFWISESSPFWISESSPLLHLCQKTRAGLWAKPIKQWLPAILF